MTIREWFEGRLPDWFTGDVQITVDRDEVLVVGSLPIEEGKTSAEYAEGRINRFREQTRAERIEIADEAEARFGRKTAWGASYADTTSPSRRCRCQ